VFHTAAKNPDGSMVLVLTNPDDVKDVTVACGGQTAKIALKRIRHHAAVETDLALPCLVECSAHGSQGGCHPRN